MKSNAISDVQSPHRSNLCCPHSGSLFLVIAPLSVARWRSSLALGQVACVGHPPDIPTILLLQEQITTVVVARNGTFNYLSLLGSVFGSQKSNMEASEGPCALVEVVSEVLWSERVPPKQKC